MSNRTPRSDSLGGSEALTYVLANRLTRKSFAGNGSTGRADWTYDARGLMTQVSRFASMLDASLVAKTVIGYDVMGRETARTHKTATGTTLQTSAMTYDRADRLITQTGDGATIAASYNGNDELIGDGIAARVYDATGNRTRTGVVTGAGNEVLRDSIWAYALRGRQSGRWVLAQDLRVGDELLLREENTARLDRVELAEVEARVYNFSVAELSNYPVSRLGILVHNTNDRPKFRTAEPSEKVDIGRGDRVQHFTDLEGISGITGVPQEVLTALKPGQQLVVDSVHFKPGVNPFMTGDGGGVGVTKLGSDALPGQLEGIGVFGKRQQYVIEFSQETTVKNGVQMRPDLPARSIWSLPGDTTLKGTITVRKVQ